MQRAKLQPSPLQTFPVGRSRGDASLQGWLPHTAKLTRKNRESFSLSHSTGSTRLLHSFEAREAKWRRKNWVFITKFQEQSSSSMKTRNSQSSQELCSLYSHSSVGIHAGNHQVKDPRITNLLCRLHGEEEVSQQLLRPTLQLFPEWDEAFAPQDAEICFMIPPQCPCPIWACQWQGPPPRCSTAQRRCQAGPASQRVRGNHKATARDSNSC